MAVIASALQGVVRRRASRFALLAAGSADSPEAVAAVDGNEVDDSDPWSHDTWLDWELVDVVCDVEGSPVVHQGFSLGST